MDGLCFNAPETGMLDDPRTNFDTPIGDCKHYKPKQLLGDIPDWFKVCGNCEWYSVQGEMSTKEGD